MAKKRVAFEFDERSLMTLDQMRERGVLVEEGAGAIHHHTPFPVSEEEYRSRINRLSHELETERSRVRTLEAQLEQAKANKESCLTRLRESATFWKERSDIEHARCSFRKADRYDAKREALEDVLADLEAACNQLFAEELQRKPEPTAGWGCPFDEPL